MTRSVEVEQAIARAVLRDCQLTDEEFAAQQAVTPVMRRRFRANTAFGGILGSTTVTMHQFPPEPEVRFVLIPYGGPGAVSRAVW